MNREYYILLEDGTRAGPCAEEEILDLLESGDLDPEDKCMHAESGRVLPAGEMFRVIAPEVESESEPETTTVETATVPWKPAPFPSDEPKPAPRPKPKLVYRGCPSALNYWRSTVLAGVIYASGLFVRQTFPDLFLVSQICGSLILLGAILRLIRTQYFITTRCVIMYSGLMARSSRELPLGEISAIHVERRGLPGLLGIGTVIFSSVRGAANDVVFRQVWRASALKKLVRKLQEAVQGLSAT